MIYNEALEYINNAGGRGIRPGLDTMERLLSAMGEPQKKLNNIHIAGTNGKGSVGAFIAEGLIANGFSVGRYFSPALLEEREILSYNNVPISPEEFAQAVCRVKRAEEISGTKPTSFEIETAAAFYWLNKRRCDFTVTETGMGGRLDATNIADNIVAVITPIALDHMSFLGNTIEEIAEEKAGIIRDICISAPQEKSVRGILEKKGDVLFCGQAENIRYENDRTLFDYKDYRDIEIPLLGRNQTENAVLAIEVLEKLRDMGYNIKIGNIFKNTKWPFRFEKLRDKPLVFADGAHNTQGAWSLAENIRLYRGNRSLALVMGVLADKDYRKMAEAVAPMADKIFTVTPDSPRALDRDILKEVCAEYTDAVSCDTATAVKRAMEYEMAVIFGTFTIMKAVYEIFRR